MIQIKNKVIQKRSIKCLKAIENRIYSILVIIEICLKYVI